MPATINHHQITTGMHQIGANRLMQATFNGEGARAERGDFLWPAIGEEVLDVGVGAAHGAIQQGGDFHIAKLEAQKTRRVGAALRRRAGLCDGGQGAAHGGKGGCAQ